MKNKGIMYRLDMKKAPKRCYGGENDHHFWLFIY